jgi:hypothetical protein
VVGICNWKARATPSFSPRLAIDSWDGAAKVNVDDHIERVVDWVKSVGGGGKAGSASYGRKINTGMWFNTTEGRWKMHFGAYYGWE